MKSSGGSAGGDFLFDDGIAVWFNGPEWDEVVAESMKNAADQVQATAQQAAPWADRSGDARAGLTADVEESNGEIVLTLYHTVEYGLWLEVIQNGRFAVIMKTLEEEAPRILRDAVKAVDNARIGRN